jgi:hypothetical protein
MRGPCAMGMPRSGLVQGVEFRAPGMGLRSLATTVASHGSGTRPKWLLSWPIVGWMLGLGGALRSRLAIRVQPCANGPPEPNRAPEAPEVAHPTIIAHGLPW